MPSGVVRHCVRFKMTPAGKRCSKFAPGPGRRVRGVGQPTGMTCTRLKTVTDKHGNRVKRCAAFNGKKKGKKRRKTKGGLERVRGNLCRLPTGQFTACG